MDGLQLSKLDMQMEAGLKQFDRKLRSVQLDEEKEKKKKARNKGILITVILFVAAASITVLVFAGKKWWQKPYDTYGIVSSQELTTDSSVRYAVYGQGYITYDRDGVRAFTASGEQLWNASYNLKNPIIAVCEPYTAVADKGAGQFYIIDNKGTTNTFSISGKIADIAVAVQGVTAVLATEKDRDHIYLFEPNKREQLVDIMIMTKQNGFPMAIALSQDGKKLVTSYLSTEGGALKSWVTFYNFGDVGQNFVDQMVGSYAFDAIVPEVAFLTNEMVIVGGDNSISLYRMTEVPKVRMNENFDMQIKSIFYSSTYTGVVLKGKTGEQDKLFLYNNNKAKKVLEIDFTYEYNDIYTQQEDIVLYGGQEMTILRTNGKLKFHTTFSKNVKYVFGVDNKEKYLVIGDQVAELIQLKRQ